MLAALPADRCGLRETARVVGLPRRESAGQCGPCLNGLPRIAAALDLLARPAAAAVRTAADVKRWSGLLPGRGACSHPDATVRLVGSALRVFSDELARHRAGRCSARTAAALPAGAREPAMTRLAVDPIRCTGHGLCAGTAARGHHARRVGLSAARLRRAAAGPGADGEEGRGRLPDAGAAAAGRPRRG